MLKQTASSVSSCLRFTLLLPFTSYSAFSCNLSCFSLNSFITRRKTLHSLLTCSKDTSATLWRQNVHNKNMHWHFQNTPAKKTSHMIFLVCLASFSGDSRAMALIIVATEKKLKTVRYNISSKF
jgi:hypothetical protein